MRDRRDLAPVAKVACRTCQGTIGLARSEIRPCNGTLLCSDSCYMTMSQHPSYGGRLARSAAAEADRPVTPEPAAVYEVTPRYAERACCCAAASPAVIAVMPPAGDRQTETDLLLCGHHYRA